MGKFLKKNHKLIILVLLLLFMIKNFQSCMRQEKIERTQETAQIEKDSIKRIKNNQISNLEDSIDVQDDSIKLLNYRIDLYKERATAAEQRAVAVQSTAEKIKSHTTVSIEDKREAKDTTSNKQK